MEAIFTFIVGSVVGSTVVTWLPVLRRQGSSSTLPPQKRYTLEQIKGIGPVYASRLREAGIVSVPQLAVASPAELWQIASGGHTNLRMNVNAWIEQAKDLMAQTWHTGKGILEKYGSECQVSHWNNEKGNVSILVKAASITIHLNSELSWVLCFAYQLKLDGWRKEKSPVLLLC